MSALSQKEIEAIEQYQADQAREKAENTDRERTLEDVYLDAFTDYSEGTRKPPHILEALATVAAFFHDEDPEFQSPAYIDNASGMEIRGSDANNAQFNQKGILGNFCQQADWMLQREEKRMHFLRNKATRARQASLNGEIDSAQLEAAELEYGRCKIVNLPMLEDFKKAAKIAYKVQFGEDWTRPVKKDSATTTAQLEDRFTHQKSRRSL